MLSAVLWSLLFVAGALLVLIGAVVLSPVRLRLRASTAPDPRLTISARIFAGLSPVIPIHDSGREKRKKNPAPPKRQKRRRKSARGPRYDAARIVRAVPGLLRRLAGLVHIDRIAVDADVGLTDVADTGHLFGLIAAFSYSIPHGERAAIAVRPDFTGERFSGSVEADIRFVPAAFLPPALQFAWQAFGPRR